jgi:hypothetical protein
MNKETRDALRRTQRQLRDEFQARARSLQASANGALNAALQAAAMDPAAREMRALELDGQAARLKAIRSTVLALPGAEVTSVGAHG